jgi:hypothetical protein
MKQKNSVALGIILILFGLFFLGREIMPQYFPQWDWPFTIIGLGGVFLLWAIFSGTGGLAVPGAILAGIGGIFYYQNLTGDWNSWSFIWALIPAFVGVGIIIGGIIDRNYKEAFSGGLTLAVYQRDPVLCLRVSLWLTARDHQVLAGPVDRTGVDCPRPCVVFKQTQVIRFQQVPT